jgi:SET domain-containing protein
MNHSDTPNTDGIYALRDISAGEELTEDYKTMGDWHPLTLQAIGVV